METPGNGVPTGMEIPITRRLRSKTQLVQRKDPLEFDVAAPGILGRFTPAVPIEIGTTKPRDTHWLACVSCVKRFHNKTNSEHCNSKLRGQLRAETGNSHTAARLRNKPTVVENDSRNALSSSASLLIKILIVVVNKEHAVQFGELGSV